MKNLANTSDSLGSWGWIVEEKYQRFTIQTETFLVHEHETAISLIENNVSVPIPRRKYNSFLFHGKKSTKKKTFGFLDIHLLEYI
jgi:hypothetical protein